MMLAATAASTTGVLMKITLIPLTHQGTEKDSAVWEHILRCKFFCEIQCLSDLPQGPECMGLETKLLGGPGSPQKLLGFSHIQGPKSAFQSYL